MKIQKATREKIKQAVKQLKKNDKRRRNIKTVNLGAKSLGE